MQQNGQRNEQRPGRQTEHQGGRSRPLGLRALAEAVGTITQPLIARRGLSIAVIAADWPMLVGESLAAVSLPEKVATAPRTGNAATLTVRVAHGAVAIELQHREPQLIERINQHFGYGAIGRLRFRHAPLPPSAARLPACPRPVLSETDAAHLAQLCDDIENSRLRQALAGLGEKVLTMPDDIMTPSDKRR